jgi:HD-GYP domain-containing protein (c-di-GMP phosphodiesterase class II)
MAFVPLEPCALRLGLFIKIEGSWFSHPFPTNSFKVNAAKDLETLRGLKAVKLFVDIERSDPESSTTPDLSESPLQDQVGNIVVEEPVAQDNADSSIPWEVKDSVEDQMQRKVAQHEAFQDYQSHLQQVENQLQGVLQESKQSVQDVVAGRPRGFRTAQKIVGNLLDLLDGPENSRALLNLIGTNETSEEFFLHATNVCSLSMMIGLDLGLSREENEKLALGAFFHDVGELKYPAETLLRKGVMGQGELKSFLRTHPQYGVEMMEKIPNFPYEAIDVIHQHHERLNGSGQPSGKKDAQISTFAKIAMVVDLYDELCHHPDPAQSLTPSEALSYLYVKCQKTLWQDAIVSLVKQLGVYPPGSLVQLSNQKTGLVTSVNVGNRLRPIILVHDQHAPTEEPMVLNLAEEDDSLTIVEAIRPGDLSPQIRECLNPRRIISYFPSSTPVETYVPQ